MDYRILFYLPINIYQGDLSGKHTVRYHSKPIFRWNHLSSLVSPGNNPWNWNCLCFGKSSGEKGYVGDSILIVCDWIIW